VVAARPQTPDGRPAAPTSGAGDDQRRHQDEYTWFGETTRAPPS
jgi:hypothetical protein